MFGAKRMRVSGMKIVAGVGMAVVVCALSGCGSGGGSSATPPPAGAPVVALSAAALTFASTTVGVTSAAQTVTVTNTGTAALTISGVAVSGANASSFAETTTCGSVLAAGGSCAVSVTFTPAAAGAASAAVSITDNASGSPQSVTLSGTGTAPAAPGVMLNPTSLTFTGVNLGSSSAAQSVMLTNTGNALLTISSIGVTGMNASSFAQTNSCGASVAVGGSCTISVTFTPSAAGVLTAAISVADNGAGSPQTVGLTGTGVGVAAVQLTPSSLGFGPVAAGTSSAVLSSMVTNTGTGTLTISSIASTSAAYTDTTTCGATLAVGASCTVSVTFRPTVTGVQTASVLLTDNAAGSPQSISLSGTGTTGTVQLPTPSQPTVLYGVVVTGTSSPVSGAAVKVSYVNSSGFSTTLGTTTTGSDGSFYFYVTGTPSFSCPTATSPVYVTATGGTPAGVGAANPQLSMATIVGNCGTMTSAVVNEATTVAALSALGNYFNNGVNSLSVLAMQTTYFPPQFAAATQLVNPATGAVPGTLPAGATAEVAKINGMADILYTCTHSRGGTSGDGSACGTLLAATTGLASIPKSIVPTDSFTAMYAVANFLPPWIHGVSALLPASGVPFAPVWTSAPMDLVAHVLPLAAAPTFSPAAGNVTGGVVVTLKSATPGAAIYYTTDGSPPTASSTKYLGPFALTSSTTVNAVAQDHITTMSAATSASYVVSGPHITLTVPSATIPVAAGTTVTGTITLSAPAAATTTIALTSGAPNVVQLTAASATIAAGSSTGSFTFKGTGAGMSVLTASASGYGTGTVAERVTMLTGANQVTMKAPIFGFTAVNYQGFTTSPSHTIDNAQEEINGAPNVFAGSAVNVKWSDLEPAPGSFDFTSIESALGAMAASNTAHTQSVKAKLRIFSANVTPAWLTTEENGGIVMTVSGTNYLDGLFWSQDYREHWTTLMNALAAEYDTRTDVQEMVGSMCANSTDEPMIIGFATYATGANGGPSMLDQGYSDAKREACEEYQGQSIAGFTVSPIYLPFGGYSIIDTGLDQGKVGFTIEMMRYWAEQKGAQGIVGENSLQPAAAKMAETDEYPIYQEFPILQAIGTGSGTQTALQNKLDQVCTNTGGDDFACWDPTVQYGVQVGNREIEMWNQITVTFAVGGKGQQDFSNANLAYWKSKYF